jgi:PSP1 C-terminal conserved region
VDDSRACDARRVEIVADIDPFEGAPALPKIVAVSLQQTGHLYNFLAGERPLRRGERVLVESEAGARVGTVEIEPHEPAQTIDLSQLRPIIRIASDNDFYLEQENLSREAYARRLCVERIRERRIQMKLVNADYTFDGRKVTFYFVAEGRSRQPGARAGRDETEWRARRDQSHRRAGSLRTRAMLLELAARLRGGDGQDGARAGTGAQSVAAGRDVRTA